MKGMGMAFHHSENDINLQICRHLHHRAAPSFGWRGRWVIGLQSIPSKTQQDKTSQDKVRQGLKRQTKTRPINKRRVPNKPTSSKGNKGEKTF